MSVYCWESLCNPTIHVANIPCADVFHSPLQRGMNFSRQNLTSVDVRF